MEPHLILTRALLAGAVVLLMVGCGGMVLGPRRSDDRLSWRCSVRLSAQPRSAARHRRC
ncbi:MAG: hypothetical protein R3C16_12725 [Hyphomonadaceae bacterium]